MDLAEPGGIFCFSLCMVNTANPFLIFFLRIENEFGVGLLPWSLLCQKQGRKFNHSCSLSLPLPPSLSLSHHPNHSDAFLATKDKYSLNYSATDPEGDCRASSRFPVCFFSQTL